MSSTLIEDRQSERASHDVECERMKFRFYRDVFGGWRWDVRQADGHFVDSAAVTTPRRIAKQRPAQLLVRKLYQYRPYRGERRPVRWC